MNGISIATLALSIFLATVTPTLVAAENTVFGTDESTIISRLRYKGVHATGVEEWGDLVRAFVTTADGGQAMEFFERDTLQPVDLGGNTRVLTELNVGN